MIKSVRVDPELAARLERAARAADVTASEFIRDAVERRCRAVLGASLSDRLEPFIGLFESSGGRASDTGGAFRESLSQRRRG